MGRWDMVVMGGWWDGWWAGAVPNHPRHLQIPYGHWAQTDRTGRQWMEGSCLTFYPSLPGKQVLGGRGTVTLPPPPPPYYPVGRFIALHTVLITLQITLAFYPPCQIYHYSPPDRTLIEQTLL